MHSLFQLRRCLSHRRPHPSPLRLFSSLSGVQKEGCSSHGFVHPSAIVHPNATLGEGVSIGPFCTVGPSVKLGKSCKLYPGSHVFGNSDLGDNCTLMMCAVVGDELPGQTVIGELSLKPPSDGGETGRSFSYPHHPHTFAFKLEDRRGRVHRFISDTGSLTDLITCILQRVGDDIDRQNLPQILYEDDEHDFVVLASDSDLAAAVDHARAADLKKFTTYETDGSNGSQQRYKKGSSSGKLDYTQTDAWAAAYSTVAAGAALVAGLGVLAYLKRNG